jgi:hypothetical protein
MKQRASAAEEKAQQQGTALTEERQRTEAAKRGRDESQAQIERLQRRLESEQERRSAAERRVEELQKDQGSPPQTSNPTMGQRASDTSLGHYRDLADGLEYDPATPPHLRQAAKTTWLLVGALQSYERDATVSVGDASFAPLRV